MQTFSMFYVYAKKNRTNAENQNFGLWAQSQIPCFGHHNSIQFARWHGICVPRPISLFLALMPFLHSLKWSNDKERT